MFFIVIVILSICVSVRLKLFGNSASDNLLSGLGGAAIGLMITLVLLSVFDAFGGTYSTYTNVYNLSKIDNKYPYMIDKNENIIVRYVDNTDALCENTFDKDIVNINAQNTPTQIRITVKQENPPKDWQRILFLAENTQCKEIEFVDIY